MTTTTGTGWPRTALLTTVLVFLAVESTAVASLGTPLLAAIQRSDHVSLAASQWALTITLLSGSVATPLLGRLGDGRLRRPVILATIAVMLAGCVLSALPGGFGVFLAGRALQGAGFGLVPLATAVARDNLPGQRSRAAIAWIGVTTAVGIGAGYPLVGLLAQYLGLGAPFWLVAGLSAVALAGAAAVLPPSPDRPARADLPGAGVLALAVTALLLLLAQGPSWGWAAPASLACAAASVLLAAGWVIMELRARHPLVSLRLLRRRPVLAANVTAFGVALGFYPLASLVVRFVQTPAAAGYGFGAPVVVAGLMLAPFSAASLAGARVARRLARRYSPEIAVAGACVLLIASMVMFGLARSTYWQVLAAMAVDGFGVGCVYAVNPLQITAGIPAAETGSAMSFYQVARTVAYSLGSALSATVLVAYVRPGQVFPAASGYTAAAGLSTAILIVALVVSAAFAWPVRSRSRSVPPPGPGTAAPGP